MDSFLEERHSENLSHDRVDYAYEIKRNSIIYLQRYLRPNSRELVSLPVAKFSYSFENHNWSIFWRTKSDRWQVYKPAPLVDHLGEVFEVLEYDEVGI